MSLSDLLFVGGELCKDLGGKYQGIGIGTSKQHKFKFLTLQSTLDSSFINFRVAFEIGFGVFTFHCTHQRFLWYPHLCLIWNSTVHLATVNSYKRIGVKAQGPSSQTSSKIKLFLPKFTNISNFFHLHLSSFLYDPSQSVHVCMGNKQGP